MNQPRIVAYYPPRVTCRWYMCQEDVTDVVYASDGQMLGPYCPEHANAMLEILQRGSQEET